jgi:hypothetical protein
LSFFYESSKGQVLIPSDFTLWTGPDGTGTTLIGSSITINGGRVGARKLVQTTGNVTFIGANIHSGDKIILTNSNIVGGLITAANSSLSTGTILSIGSSTNVSGNIDVNGNVVIGGGTVSGKVTIPLIRPVFILLIQGLHPEEAWFVDPGFTNSSCNAR